MRRGRSSGIKPSIDWAGYGIRPVRFLTATAHSQARTWNERGCMRRILATSGRLTLTWLRLILGIVFFAHGAQKALGWFGGGGFNGTMAMFEGRGVPAVFAFLAIMAEWLGGLGLILGFLSRIAAFGILCNMLVAIATVHARNGLFMNWSGNQRGEGFEYHLLAIAIAVTIIVEGAGAFSVDHALTRPRPLDSRRTKGPRAVHPGTSAA